LAFGQPAIVSMQQVSSDLGNVPHDAFSRSSSHHNSFLYRDSPKNWLLGRFKADWVVCQI